MKIKAFVALSAAALSLAALAPAPAEAYHNGYRHRQSDDGGYRSRDGYRDRQGGDYGNRGQRGVAGPLYETHTGNAVVRERMYGNCYVRNVTTVDEYGRKIVRRTKTC